MNIKKAAKILLFLGLALIVLIFGCGQKNESSSTAAPLKTAEAMPLQTTETEIPKYVFYLIGDGLGAAQRQIAKEYLMHITSDSSAKLAMNQMLTAGTYTTYSLDSDITDSAAAGTALACGVKTNNGYISVTPNGKSTKTLAEAVQEIGYATGIITSKRITDATAAVFAAHNADRSDESGIAQDYLDSNVDFFAGGGLRYFLPGDYTAGGKDPLGMKITSARSDDIDLIQEFADKGYHVFAGTQGTADFASYEPWAGDKVFAAFTDSNMPYELDRVNTNTNIMSLSEITQTAIDLLSLDPEGFFLMVEGGRIDNACHTNDIAAAVYDILEFDEVVKTAIDFYREYPQDTLIIVAGDHETGGLIIGDESGTPPDLKQMDGITMSFLDGFHYAYQPDEDREEYFDFLETIGIKDLTHEEKAKIEQGMDMANINKSTSGYNEAGIAVNHIVAERIGIQWTTYGHTDARIPLSVMGVSQDSFIGLTDNTQIAGTLANILSVKIG
ncbi:MAG: alkaline phosphatase [Christensenellales bacterium]|jgi:alkaline phosphatase